MVYLKKTTLFKYLFGWLVFLFVVIFTIGISLVTHQQTETFEKSLIDEHKLLTQITSSQLEAGYLSGVWPFELLHRISKSENVVFWRVICPDGTIKFTNDTNLWGKKEVSIPFTEFVSLTVKDAVLPEVNEKIKIIINPLRIKERGKSWTFCLGVSLKQVSSVRQRLIITNFVFGIAIFTVVSLLLFFLTKSITKPIGELVKGAEAISSGNLDYKIKVKSENEIGELADAFNKMSEDLSKTMVSKDYVDNIIKSMIDTLVVTDPEGKIKTVNHATLELLGYEEKELIGKPVEILFTEEEAPFKRAEWEELLNEGSVRDYEMTYRTKTGEKIPVSFSGSVMYGPRTTNYELRTIGIVGIARDMRGIRQLQEQLIQSEKLAAIGQLAAGLAHELKNPLNVIRISGHYLRRKFGKEEDLGVKDSLQHLENEVNRSVKLVDDLLQFSKPSKLMTEPLDINTVIEETLSFVEKRVPIQNIKLVKEYSADLPKFIGDKVKLQQVFLNILINAIQSMPDGGELKIVTNGDRDDRFVVIKFFDTGEGISEEDLPKIFDPFFTTRKTGAGLGLSVSYGIIQQHNGTIEVESKEGKGTAFTIKLPIHPVR